MKWQTIRWQTLQGQSYVTEFFYQSWFVFKYLWRSSIGILKLNSKCSSDRQSDRNIFLSTLIWLQSYIPNDSWSYLCFATLAWAYFSFLVVSICNTTMHLFILSLSAVLLCRITNKCLFFFHFISFPDALRVYGLAGLRVAASCNMWSINIESGSWISPNCWCALYHLVQPLLLYSGPSLLHTTHCAA